MKEYTHEEAIAYAVSRGKNTRFYINVYGWSCFYTLKPTIMTPGVCVQGFRRTHIFQAK